MKINKNKEWNLSLAVKKRTKEDYVEWRHTNSYYIEDVRHLPSPDFLEEQTPKVLEFTLGLFHPRQLLHRLSGSELQLHRESSSNLSESSKLNRSHSSLFHCSWGASWEHLATASCAPPLFAVFASLKNVIK